MTILLPIAPIPLCAGRIRPRIGFGTSGMGRDYRFGYGLGLIGATGPAFELGTDVQRRESINGNGGDHALVARFTARW